MFTPNQTISNNEKYIKKVYLIIFLILWANIYIFSQDLHFSQLSQTQLYSNPAFAGISYGPKVMLEYRNQYPRIGSEVNSGYNSLLLSYDQFAPTINSGFGLQVIGDKYGENVISKYQIEAIYAYQLKFDRFQALRLGMSTNLNLQQLDVSNLRFYDQIDPIAGFSQNLPTLENVGTNYNSSYFNLNTGAVYFRNNFYVGVSAKNLLPKKNYYSSSQSSNFNQTLLSAQMGAIVRLGKENQYAFFPLALYERQNGYQKLVLNLLAQYKMINIGIGTRHNFSEMESIIFLFGCNFNQFRFSYSYDVVTNALSSYSGGTHEVGIRILLKGEDNSLSPIAEKEIIYCPDFLKN